MIAGTKPREYYRDAYGYHPIFALSSFVDAGEIAGSMIANDAIDSQHYAADSIDDEHINWGTGAGQVSAADLPIADAGGRYTGTEVETALQEIAGSGRTSETVKGNADAIAAAVPPGVIWPYGGASAPSGFLMCDGSAVSRTTYAALFAVIGEEFGVGDGSTTFNVPNLQGVSPTGVGAQDISGRTKTGPALGEVREDVLQHHFHRTYLTQGSGTNVSGYSGTVSKDPYDVIKTTPFPWSIAGEPIAGDGYGTPRTGAYTHGPEIGVNYIIKT